MCSGTDADEAAEQMSEHLAELRIDGDGWIIEDLGSTNGILGGPAVVFPLGSIGCRAHEHFREVTRAPRNALDRRLTAQSLPLPLVPGDQPRQDLSLVFAGLMGQRRQHDGTDGHQHIGLTTAQNIRCYPQPDQGPDDAATSR